MTDVFAPGQLVCLTANSARMGPIISELPSVAGEKRFQVFHGPNDIRSYLSSQLSAVHVSIDVDCETPFAPASLLDAQSFIARLTATRLSHPETDSLYALYAARVMFVPFQYKPLLRLLRSDQMRLLIADEVGVGKTIEAGLILKELHVRQRLDRVLIVCPKSLIGKWRAEMRRFDEDFEVLNSETLRYCLRESHQDGQWPSHYGRCIVPLEVVRQEEILIGSSGKHKRYGFRELNPAPRFDLLIVDEAHHLRNTQSHSYQALHFLAGQSEAAILLSATPVHVGSQNLFVLLNLLRPDLFPDQSVFEEMAEPNKWITEAMRLARGREQGWEIAAGSALVTASQTTWGRSALSADPRFTIWVSLLMNGAPLADQDRVRCLRDLEEVHTLAHVMNRTRRRDIGRFTIREPHTLSIEFTAEQRRFYEDLLQFRRDMLSLRYDPRVVRLITDTLERQASSCLPALIPLLDRILGAGSYDPNLASDIVDEEDEFTVEQPTALPRHLLLAANELRRQMEEMPVEDPKFDRLAKLAHESMRPEHPGKLLVFSFFLHTLAYLEKRLRTLGLRVATITGRLSESEREDLRDRFRLPRLAPNALDILLSSEVGCEGLDYEFCDRLVNYDIPWNPMRIEQRIGRIDRFGQKAKKILIFNFITPGTVEERIFFRCFERLGLFRDTVGDLEEVLGEVVSDLKRLALDADLSSAQAEVYALQTADNVVRLQEERSRLSEATSGLIGIEHEFLQEVDALQAEGRFVAPADIRAMVKALIVHPDFRGRLVANPSNPLIERIILKQDGKAYLSSLLADLSQMDRSRSELQRWLDSQEDELSVTFDQSTAVQLRLLPFITPVHALSKIAIAFWTREHDLLRTHMVSNCPDLASGEYVFACHLWETHAATPQVRMVVTAMNLDTRDIEADCDRFLNRVLGSGTSTSRTSVRSAAALDSALHALEEHIHALRAEELVRLRSSNNAAIARKLANIDAFHNNRLARVDTELAAASDPRIERMRQSERSRIVHEHASARTLIEARRDADITSQRIALGLVKVIHA